MFSQVKKLASFFYPILIDRIPSKVSGEIELSLQNGKLVLDSSSANYSYGSLHKLFQKALKKMVLTPKPQNALILGFGGGSIAEILNNEMNLDLKITGLDKDRVVVKIYHEYFKKEIHKSTLIEGDALTFLKLNSQKFDVILIDVFNNLEVPDEFLTANFLELLVKASHNTTQIIMNTTLDSDHDFVNLWQNKFNENAEMNRLSNINLVLFSLPLK